MSDRQSPIFFFLIDFPKKSEDGGYVWAHSRLIHQKIFLDVRIYEGGIVMPVIISR